MTKIQRKEGNYVRLEDRHTDDFGYTIEMDAEVRDGQVKEATLRTVSLNSNEFSIATLFWKKGGVDRLIAFLRAVEAETG